MVTVLPESGLFHGADQVIRLRMAFFENPDFREGCFDCKPVELIHRAITALTPEIHIQGKIKTHQVGDIENITAVKSLLNLHAVPVTQDKTKRFEENVVFCLSPLHADHDFLRQSTMRVVAGQVKSVSSAHGLCFVIPGDSGLGNFTTFVTLSDIRIFAIMKQSLAHFIFMAVAGILNQSALAQDSAFNAHVRPTDPLTPAEQRETFSLPPGFDIRLVVAEPHIAKPMNMAFDHQGRLWVTTSDAYPWAIKDGEHHKFMDSLIVLNDLDGDGSADEINTFADNLNIPIGVYPYKNGAIVWSIDTILNLQDTDGDLVADVREVLYGPLGHPRDTHGMQNAFRRGYDGWLYVNHGFNNDSTITAKDGSEIRLNSGNTYRIRVDGSRVEQFTWGQVNPFGSSFDKYGFLYTADCHSLPIYQLIPGAYYPSFGKPHDGLGFAPMVMQHSHGSTAISGLVIMDDPIWPDDLHENIFVGNVMTSRINRDEMSWLGSSPKAREMPDFLSTSDPWFRPVDLQWGPDGALYVADFYNRIIGHYEVPLTHPERDRHRGRIWRITYNGPDGNTRWNYPRLNLTTRNFSGALAELASPNRTRRHLALDFLTDRMPARAQRAFESILSSPERDPHSRVMALWGLERLGALTDARLANAAVDSSENMRIQAYAILAGRPSISGAFRSALHIGLLDDSPRVRRMVVRAMSAHPGERDLVPLLQLADSTPETDDHLHHRIRMAVRNILASMKDLNSLADIKVSPSGVKLIDEVLPAVRTASAAGFILDRNKNSSASLSNDQLDFLARYLPADMFGELASRLPEPNQKTLRRCLNNLKTIRSGLQSRGLTLPDAGHPLRSWADSVSLTSLNALTDLPEQSFRFIPDRANSRREIPWFSQTRTSSDGDTGSLFMGSLPPGGESWTGTLVSEEFEVPEKLSFFMAGHRGYPDRDAHELNAIRLVDARSGQILKQSFPPRHDTAHPYTWALGEFAGRRARLEVIDGDTGDAYAWLAVGRFNPPVVSVTDPGPRQTDERVHDVLDAIGSEAGLTTRTLLEKLFLRRDVPPSSRLRLATTLNSMDADAFQKSLPEFMKNFADRDPWFHKAMIGWMASRSDAAGLEFVAAAFPEASTDWQMHWATSLASHPAGARLAVRLLLDGKATRRILEQPNLANRLRAAATPDQRDAFGALIESIQSTGAGHPPLSARLTGVRSHDSDTGNGQKLFATHCAVCHQKAGQGKLVGPQLDGIGSRGLERLLEDIIDPGSNLDQAFRLRQIETIDGSVHNGLFRRQDGKNRIFVDATGTEFMLNADDIVSEEELNQSPMPPNFGQILNDKSLSDLTAFLMDK